MPKAQRRLFDIDPQAIALVDKAANRRRFLLFKAEDPAPSPITPTEGDGDMPDLTRDQLVEALQGFEGDTDTLLEEAGLAAVAPAGTGGDEPSEMEALEKRIAALEKAEGADSAEVTLLKSALDQLKKAEERTQALEDQVMVEREQRLSKEYLQKAAGIDGLSGEPDMLAKALRAIDDGIQDEEVRKFLHSALEEGSVARKQNELLKQRSNPAAPSVVGDAYTALLQKAEEIRKAEPELSKEKAFQKAYNDHSDLRQAYEQEQMDKRQRRTT